MNILYFFRGITKFTVQTGKPASLISRIRIKAPLRDIKPISEDCVELSCFCDFSKKVRQAINEQGGKIVQESSFGIPPMLYRYRCRIGLFLPCIAMLLLMFVSQLFVWEIRVEGNEKISDGEIIKTLNEIGFKEGVSKKSVKLDSLVNNFLIREKRVSWIAVNFDGSVAHVEIREGKNPELLSKNKNVNLVASHDGIIMRADVLEGGSLVKKGDVVHKGQLLVSAFIDRNEKSTLRGARGTVWANTERTVTVRVPLEYEEKKYTDNVKNEYVLKVLGRKIAFIPPSASFALSTKTITSTKASVSDKVHLPFELIKSSFHEYTVTTCRRTEKQALEIARETAKTHIAENIPSFVIAAVEEENETVQGTVVYTCRFSGIENIAKQMEFKME